MVGAALLLVVVGALQKRSGPPASPLPGVALRDLAQRSGRYAGTAVDATALDRERGYRDDIHAEFSAVTAENAMKWQVVAPSRGHSNWSGADALVDFARSHRLRIRGHTLVWHIQNPGWIDPLSRADTRRALEEHIVEEVRRYRGQIADWDVVNEAVADDGRLRDSVWLRRLGPGYIAQAFRLARVADPDARLWINEIGAESVGPKSDRLYALVRDLLAAGVPIGGVGFQGHFSLSGVPDTFAENLARFAKLGVKVAITELDVRLPLPTRRALLYRQAKIYGDAASACTAVAACVGVTVWGFTDRHSWIPSTAPGFGAATVLDEGLHAKPAYLALQRALR